MKKICLLLCLCSLLWSCADESSNPVESSQLDFIYPVEVGNKWEYEVKRFNLNVRGDSTQLVSIDTLISIVKVEITGTAILPDSTEVFAFQESLISESGDTTQHILYYRNESSGLYLYGFQENAMFLPKNSAQTNTNADFSFNKISALPGLGIANSDSVFLPEYPFKILQYPLQIGIRWLFIRVPEMPYNADKAILDVGNLETPAGNFECYEI